jgi:branched-chain amino acid aminotransferase
VIAYVDGAWTPAEEARVPVLDHGLLYGDGVFEGIRVYGGRPFLLDEHLTRLAASARAIVLELPAGRAEIAAHTSVCVYASEGAWFVPIAPLYQTMRRFLITAPRTMS